MDATFDMTFTGVNGGPCPLCNHSGQLMHHYGTYGTNGWRNIHHLDELGRLHKCTVASRHGVLYADEGRWWYRKREAWD